MKLKKNLKLSKLQPAQIIALGFLAVILAGAFLLTTPFVTESGESIGFINALFTSSSAVCVTGLTVVDTGTYWNYFGKTVILILIQIGGLGFMTVTSLLSLIAGRRISLKNRLMMQESLNSYNLAGVVRLTKYVVLMTFILEAIGAYLLSKVFIPEFGLQKGIYYSVFHSISAFCNAGFDILGGGKSLSDYVSNAYLNSVISGLIVLGGLGFVVIFELLRFKKFKNWTLNSKLVVLSTLFLIVVGFIFFFAFEYSNPETIGNLDLSGKITASMFGSITPRTAGFNTVPIDKMMPATMIIVISLMFIGGSPASTAGGVKTTTVALVVITIISIIRGKTSTEAFGRRISRDNVNKAIAVLGIAFSVLLTVIITLSVTETGFSLFEIAFETFSAFGTVGLSIGVSAKSSLIGKVVLSATMFLGRVGALTILLAAMSRLKDNKKVAMSYPEEKIVIG